MLAAGPVVAISWGRIDDPIQIEETLNKKAPTEGACLVWRARKDYLNQPKGCFNPIFYEAR